MPEWGIDDIDRSALFFFFNVMGLLVITSKTIRDSYCPYSNKKLIFLNGLCRLVG